MTVLITLTTAGADSGPFNLYSDLDGYTTAFESGVLKADLLAGYASSLVPDYTNSIRVLSLGACTNFIDIPTTTTTTTRYVGELKSGIISTISTITENCSEIMNTNCWIFLATDPTIINSLDTIYTNSLGTIPFVGDGNYYHVKLTDYPTEYSAPVTSLGEVTLDITTCII